MVRLVACCFTSVLPLLAIAGSASREGPALEILGRTLGPTSILSDLEELTDNVGGRPSGSAALDQAIAWGIDKFRAAGLVNVRSEPYTVPIAALPFSSGTGASGIEAEVSSVGHGEDSDFAGFKGKLRGCWVLIETVPMRSNDDLDAEYVNAPRIFLAARQAGAVGVLWMSTRPGRLLYRHPVRFDDTIDPLPGAMLDREDALRISRALAAGKAVRVKVVTEPQILLNVALANVVGEVRGYAKPVESVVLGAHLDSWDLGQGALDNGCNAVLVIDAARQIAAVAREHQPRRTIRFVLFTGEEAGFLGSRADARLHRAELDQTVAMITFDEGAGRTTGFSTGGRTDTVAAADAALQPAASLGPFTQTTDAFIGTDTGKRAQRWPRSSRQPRLIRRCGRSHCGMTSNLEREDASRRQRL
jgi:carboxypeptidase Q